MGEESLDVASISYAKCTNCPEKEKQTLSPIKTEELPKETDEEIAANVHQVVSALAEGVLILAVKRGILDKDFRLSNPEDPKKAT